MSKSTGKVFYLSHVNGYVLYALPTRQMEDVTEAILSGEGMFKLLYPEGRVCGKFFNSLRFTSGEGVFPDVPHRWLISRSALRWDCDKKGWQGWSSNDQRWILICAEDRSDEAFLHSKP